LPRRLPRLDQIDRPRLERAPDAADGIRRGRVRLGVAVLVIADERRSDVIRLQRAKAQARASRQHGRQQRVRLRRDEHEH
jgi:hypothetical protein